jgi:hypothetical protein
VHPINPETAHGNANLPRCVRCVRTLGLPAETLARVMRALAPALLDEQPTERSEPTRGRRRRRPTRRRGGQSQRQARTAAQAERRRCRCPCGQA